MIEKILIKEIVAPIIIIFVSVILWTIVKKIIDKLFERAIKKVDKKRKNTIRKITKNLVKTFIVLIALVFILDVYGVDTNSLITSLGVVGLVVGLALQDILKDFIVGITIILENQFKIGDNVTINGFQGEVIDLTLKTTRIKAFNGPVKILSNRTIAEVINHTLEDSLAIVDVDVIHGTDIDKTESILKESCLELTKTVENLTGKVECLGVQMLNPSSITFRIVAPTKPMEHFQVERTIKKELKKVLEKNNIKEPFPQLVIHNEK